MQQARETEKSVSGILGNNKMLKADTRNTCEKNLPRPERWIYQGR